MPKIKVVFADGTEQIVHASTVKVFDNCIEFLDDKGRAKCVVSLHYMKYYIVIRDKKHNGYRK